MAIGDPVKAPTVLASCQIPSAASCSLFDSLAASSEVIYFESEVGYQRCITHGFKVDTRDLVHINPCLLVPAKVLRV